MRERQENEASETALREAIRLDSENAIFHFNLGWTLNALGRRDAAIAEFRKAVRIDAENHHLGQATYSLADNLVDLGQPDDAIAVLREAALIAPDDGRVREKLAELLRSRGAIKQAADEYDRAIDGYRRTLATKPGSLTAHRGLGNLLARQGKWDEALKHLASAYKLDPSDGVAGIRTAVMYVQVGDDAGYRRHCLAMLDRADAKRPTPAGAYAVKSCLLSAKPAEIERATRLAQLAFDSDVAAFPGTDNHGWWQFDLGLAEYRNGHFARSADLLRKCRRSGGVLEVQASLILAMDCQRVGRKDDASRLLSACTKVLRATGLEGSDNGSSWDGWLACELFRREAEALIRDTPARPAEAKAANPTGATTPSTPAKPASGNKP